ncbi:hypothetical protein HNO88_002726 [Novosphingobium chloroacetimidivorans]|uniref:Uncharacterized protein n=1 Tax=Novosphingobium chloroacetimidivorans TaxID=1428314 RepID=A0A7W7KAT2_9SPHN|nr:hypothetical protein [Novosphingobium chloroacetimidivorans]
MLPPDRIRPVYAIVVMPVRGSGDPKARYGLKRFKLSSAGACRRNTIR